MKEMRARMKKYVLATAFCVLLFGGAVPVTLSAQVVYARGQDVSPTFDGWEQNPDGSYTLYFGYFNRNSEQEFHVPVGPDNNIDPGGDRGQPTYFYPSRKWWVFNVVVPKDWPKDRRVVWTLTTNGRTNQAKGWLQPEWEVDKGVIAKNASRDPSLMTAGTNERDLDLQNLPPSITISPVRTIKLPETLTLTATATDDGRPKPLPPPSSLPDGVRIRWILYRGPASVRFDPDIMSQRVYGKPATLETKVRFTMPGTYQLRAIASDGAMFSTHDVDVTVLP
jgi:hypothetical protein